MAVVPPRFPNPAGDAGAGGAGGAGNPGNDPPGRGGNRTRAGA